MPTLNIDLSQLSGIDPGIENLKNARIDFSPYSPFVDDDTWVTRNILRVKAPLGVATTNLPATPTGNAYEVQERGFRGARHGYVLVPDQPTVEYVDLVWVDKDTLDPTAPPSPAWVAALEAVQGEVDGKASVSTALRAQRLSEAAIGDRNQSRDLSRIGWEDAASVVESWANLSSWSSATFGQVSGNRLYSNGSGGNSGGNRAFVIATGGEGRAVFNVTVTSDGNGSGALGVGFTNDAAGGAFTSGAAKMRGLWFKANAQGIAQVTDGVVSANIGTTGAGTTTWVVTAVIDATWLTMTATKSDGSSEFFYRWARAGFDINNIAIFNSCGGQLTGNSAGLLGARKATVTVNPRTGVEGVARTAAWTAKNGDNLIVWLPASYDSRASMPVAILFHGNGSDETHWSSNANGKAVRDAYLAAGYIVIGAANTGAVSTWGASAGLDAYVNAYRYVRDHFNIGPVAFYANSMGSIESLLTLAADRIPGVVVWCGTVPTANLQKNYDNALFKATIASAYGIAGDGSDYATKTAGHDPMLLDPAVFRGLPMWVLVATDDTAVIPAENWDLFGPLVSPLSSDYVRVNATGGHSTTAIAGNAAALVAFADKYTKRA